MISPLFPQLLPHPIHEQVLLVPPDNRAVNLWSTLSFHLCCQQPHLSHHHRSTILLVYPNPGSTKWRESSLKLQVIPHSNLRLSSGSLVLLEHTNSFTLLKVLPSSTTVSKLTSSEPSTVLNTLHAVAHLIFTTAL